MRILIFHGYLLRGTGSNVYNASLAQALVGMGHEVHILCQDRAAAELPFVDAIGRWEGGELRLQTVRHPVRCTAYLPDIGEVLPVYVADDYEGFRAVPFPDLDDAELDRYLAANVAAVRDVCDLARPEVALANHLVMGPAILARALGDTVPYAVKVHGSALEYTVRPHRERFLPYAREGLAPAGGVLVGSRHTAESLWEVVDEPGLPGRTRLGPPGVDADRFRPRSPDDAAERLEELAARLDRQGAAAWGGEQGAAVAAPGARPESRADRDVRRQADRVEGGGPVDRGVAAGGGRGPGRAALPGGLRHLQAWARAARGRARGRATSMTLGASRPRDASSRAGRPASSRTSPPSSDGSETRGSSAPSRRRATSRRRGPPSTASAGPGAWSTATCLTSWPPARPWSCRARSRRRSEWSRRRRRAAARCPSRRLTPGWPRSQPRWRRAWTSGSARCSRSSVDDGAVEALAERLVGWLCLEPAARGEATAALSAAARRRYGWEGVANGVLAAAAGRLDEIPEPPPATASYRQAKG